MTPTSTMAPLETAPMDPALAGFLAQAAAQGNPPLESLPPTVARQIYRDIAAGLGLSAPAIAAANCASMHPCLPRPPRRRSTRPRLCCFMCMAAAS
jgi:acetyl esterase